MRVDKARAYGNEIDDFLELVCIEIVHRAEIDKSEKKLKPLLPLSLSLARWLRTSRKRDFFFFSLRGRNAFRRAGAIESKVDADTSL